MKQFITNQVKNISGWRTKRKIVVISVDDYGNVRLHSKDARDKLNQAGLKVHSHFDAYDSLETREDLEMLYETLQSVKDKNGHSAVFTPYTLPCNINFEAMEAEDWSHYRYELLPETYSKLATFYPSVYNGAWELWKEGIARGMMQPQFHGREHLNLKVFNEKLKKRDYEVLTALKNRSYTSISHSGYPTFGYTAAFGFWNFSENAQFPKIIQEGLNSFEKVFGYGATHFTSPGGREHPVIHQSLHDNGIRYLDTPFVKLEHQGKGSYRRIVNYTGKKNQLDMTYLVRNVVFEPTVPRRFDWVSYAIKQIEAAFFWHRPAIISSHRVNFCGHIDAANRKKGLDSLRMLLKEIVKRWPTAEFISAMQLTDILCKEK